MPLADLLGMGLQNQRADIQGGFAMGENLAKTQVALEDERQQMQIRKQQNDADKAAKMFQMFHTVASTQDPALRTFGAKSLVQMGQAFNMPVNQDTINLFSKSDELRAQALQALKDVDPTDPAQAAKAADLVSKWAMLPPQDAIARATQMFSESSAFAAAKLRASAWAEKLDAGVVSELQKKMGDKSALAQLAPEEQQALQQWTGKAAEFTAYLKKNPESPEALALRKLQAAGSQTQQGKEQLTAEKIKTQMQLAQERFDFQKMDRNRRFNEIMLPRLNLAQQNQAVNIVSKAQTLVQPADEVLRMEAATKDLVDSGQPLNKLTTQEAIAGLQRLYQGTGVLSEGRRKSLELNTVESFINSTLGKLDPNQPIPENIQQIYRNVYNRAYSAALEARDLKFARAAAAQAGNSPILRKNLPDIIKTYQLSDPSVKIETGVGQQPKMVKPTVDPSQYDLGQINPAFQGQTLTSYQSQIDTIQDPVLKAKRQGQLNKLRLQVLQRMGK